MNWLPTIVATLLGLVAGVGAHRWLDARRYRYADEVDFPPRNTLWVVVALPLVVGLGVLSWWDDSPVLAVVVALFGAVLVVLSAIDFDVRRLPDKFTLPLIPVTALAVAVTAASGAPVDPLRALLAGGVLGLFYFAQVILAWGKGMGLGDVKLAVSLGLVLGQLSWAHVLVGTTVAYLSALLVGVFLVLFRGGGRRTLIAFGPHMALGALTVLLAPGVVDLLRLLS